MTNNSVFGPTIKFWASTTNKNSASFRIRCKFVCEELKKRGIKSSLYNRDDSPPNIIILSKRYDHESIKHASSLKEKYGTRLFLDICDNHFIHDDFNRSQQFRSAIGLVDRVIVSTEYLNSIVQSECGSKVNTLVISDAIEMPYHPNFFKSFSDLKSEIYLRKLKNKLLYCNEEKLHRLLWFGAHQGGFKDSGMSDLLNIKVSLEIIAETLPITLTVISNSEDKFKLITKDWRIPTFYLPWNFNTFSSALKLHGISVIPITKNPFTLSKTGNRLTTSIVHGLQVVADEIPSYKQFNEYAFLGDWAGAFRSIYSGKLKSTNNFDSANFNEKIINQWMNILNY